MLTSVIGKIFLEAYNKQNNRQYTPKEFFLEVYYPIFFGHEKYLIWVQNSAVVQKLNKTEIPSEKFEGAIRQKEIIKIKKKKLIDKIENAISFDASIAVGYKAEGYTATTSGQTCIHNHKMKKDDAYLSWIGAGLGIRIGGAIILFDKPQLLLDIAEGWGKYRELINSRPNLGGNKIEAWNAIWINRKYEQKDHSLDLNQYIKENNDSIELKTISWVQLFIHICKHFKDPKMMGYFYDLGKTNKTFGFVPIVLSSIRKSYEFTNQIFRDYDSIILDELFQSWKTEYGLDIACRRGVIGLYAMEPKDLWSYLYSNKKSPKKKDKIELLTYQNWLLAMLNNKQLWEKSMHVAELLHAYRQGQSKDRTNRDNALKELLSHPYQSSFMRNISKILEEIEDKKDLMEICRIINSMPSDSVPYFVSLIKIHYINIAGKL